MAQQAVQQKNLMEIMSEIRSDPRLTKQFGDNPLETLQKMGIDTAGMKVAGKEPVSKSEMVRGCLNVGIHHFTCVYIG